MNDKIRKIASIVFAVPIDEISGSCSPDSIDTWDSLNHMNLVNALEEEFEIRFTDEEIGEMLTIDLICLITAERTGGSKQ
ncbi:MAG TPA: acyl carrier protein [Oligoflexia bacterium]|nr:acyl carrier protein [Oligoflexia bacterium]HMP48509.1 acyl carrier protein [Oligoflexia bacterium]